MLESYTRPSLIRTAVGIAGRLLQEPQRTLARIKLEQAAYSGNTAAAAELHRQLVYPTVIEFRKAATALEAGKTGGAVAHDLTETRQWFIALERTGRRTGMGLHAAVIPEARQVLSALSHYSQADYRRTSLDQADLYATFLQSTAADIRQAANDEFARLGFAQAVTVFGSLTEAQDLFLRRHRPTPDELAALIAAGQFDSRESAARIAALDRQFRRDMTAQYVRDIREIAGGDYPDPEQLDSDALRTLNAQVVANADPYTAAVVTAHTELNTLLEARRYARQLVTISLDLYTNVHGALGVPPADELFNAAVGGILAGYGGSPVPTA